MEDALPAFPNKAAAFIASALACGAVVGTGSAFAASAPTPQAAHAQTNTITSVVNLGLSTSQAKDVQE
ncbi:hypothetical protein [Streptomyces sp. NPDC056361]|uniref:hypothetical protein n=1 Tax=Streptomyces sp. NPDC056361 TaxID=3345795 RepID=UPI0035D59ACB